MADLDLIREAAVLRPGDTLLIRVDSSISHQEVDDLCKQLDEHLTGVPVKVIAAEQLVVLRGGV